MFGAIINYIKAIIPTFQFKTINVFFTAFFNATFLQDLKLNHK